MGEREGMRIRAMFDRQGRLNRLLVFNLISVENDLLIEKEWSDALLQYQDGELDDPPKISPEETDKLSQILTDLSFDQGSYTIRDLVVELNLKDFLPGKKKLFKELLVQIGIPILQLRALKTED